MSNFRKEISLMRGKIPKQRMAIEPVLVVCYRVNGKPGADVIASRNRKP